MTIKNILIFTILFICVNIYGQSDYFLNSTRRVSVETAEGEYSCEIQTEKKSSKSNYELAYYWYDKGIINTTIGAYTGYLLHGEYLRFKKNSKDILEKGSFKNGLKSGIWMIWQEDGRLDSVSTWKKGKLNGESITYNDDNLIVTRLKFKKGIQNGLQYYYEGGVLSRKQMFKKNQPYNGGFMGIKNLKLFDKKKKNKKENKESEKDNAPVEDDERSTDSKSVSNENKK
jgi:antitoxin component YwqK of YwqJK toxin-antitoxin module